ncbi:MAG: hypothetical protein R3338_15335, partial [Thermoanaerobaculia bacterium]|nr:hypothetical protein [Thermoanaerobaculia bacterium]
RHPQSSTLTVIGSASREYELEAHDFLLLTSVASQILGEENRQLLQGNLKNLFLDVEVVSGEGTALVFTSSVDNGTADQILRLQ